MERCKNVSILEISKKFNAEKSSLFENSALIPPRTDLPTCQSLGNQEAPRSKKTSIETEADHAKEEDDHDYNRFKLVVRS